MHDLDLSIVIVSWNTREILRDCLHSVARGLCGLRAEVIVVDNASADGSADMVAREFPWYRLVRNATNAGFAGGNNVALCMARGRHVLLLNSDTVVLGDVLARSVQWLDLHPDVGLMGCRVLNPDRTLQPTCFQEPSLANLALMTSGLDRLRRPRWLGRYRMRDWPRDDVRDVDVVTGCFMLVRGEALREVGDLDEGFFFCGEETDWCRRFRAAGWRVTFAPVGEIVHLGNASGRRLESRRDVLLTAGLVRLHAKHGGPLARWAAWSLLLAFNASRWALWGLADRLAPAPARRARHLHFRGVLAQWGEVARQVARPAGVRGAA